MAALRWLLMIAALTAPTAFLAAKEDPDPQPPADAGVEEPVPAELPQVADPVDEARQELLRRQRREQPIDPVPDAPAPPTRAQPAPRPVERPAGAAPQTFRNPQVRRQEGELIVYRRGRMIRTDQGPTGWLFSFDAESSDLQEPPLLLMPSQTVEQMEQVIAEQDHDTPFLVSGEIFVYHSRTYFLPRTARIWRPRGNLQP